MSAERLTAADRARVIADLRRLRPQFPKLQMPDGAARTSTRSRRRSPDECIFAQTTECFSC